MGKMGVCSSCKEYAWITDLRGYCADCVDSHPDIPRVVGGVSLLLNTRRNLQYIEERMSEYVLSVDIPLQLMKEAESCRAQIRTLEEQSSLKEEI